MNAKKYRIIILAGAGLLLQSCFVAKEYKRPDVKAENLYRTEVQVQDSTSLADISWDKIFTDNLLQGHIKKGLTNNFDIRVAVQNIVAAEAYLKQGKAGYQPTFNLGADWTHQELSNNSQLGALFSQQTGGGRVRVDQYQITGSLAWEADIWGKIRSNKRALNATYLQTVAAKQAVQTQLISDIASTYYQLLSLDMQLKIADSTLVNRNESIEVIHALKDAGNVNEVAVKQTEAQKYATEIIIEDLKNSIVLMENYMNILLGQAPGPIQRSAFEDQQLNPEIKLGFSASLLRNRPDVIAAEYALVNTFELTNVARANFYPALKVTGTGGLQTIDIDNLFSANSLFANVISGLTQPLFNQRQNRTRMEVAKANQEAAYVQFQQAVVSASREVSDALANYNNETKKIGIREQQADALTKAADYSDELLEYGLVNYLEVLTAKDNALNTQLSLVDNRYQQYLAIVTLYRALGGGWR
ncbi:efflux transporter outer membrane subunit [Flavobacterium sp. Sd200]|uniref:efflux transporter outer membrane subunit n=1 Tax=Flavobacterium sp. Sd200 TaxID=2692211 RepID=UPI001368B7B2|nr:TolC family protein [Flavobacterium sp. Sd200]MXN91384.1 efflux transporter outer membrane subunit [Flavobacterium sp. Sd200]